MSECCPLCTLGATDAYAVAHGRAYAQCPRCGLVFMARACLPDAVTQRAVYDLHRNVSHDAGYRGFLDRLALPLIERLTPGSRGLDFGCGPGPVLAAMLVEQGFEMAVYDPLYANDARVLRQTYDFITCSEVVEHFHDPALEFERLSSVLRSGGWLAIMTQWFSAERDFARWHYPRDPTHACFYAERTFEWLARRHGWRLHRPGANVALFEKA